MTVRHTPLFLNELSYPVRDEGQARELVLVLLNTLRSAKEIAPHIVVGAQMRLSDIPITSNYLTLAGVANGIGRDWWRFVAALDQRSPMSDVPACLVDDRIHVLSASMLPGEALLWVFCNDASAVSFISDEEWAKSAIYCGKCDCTSLTHSDPEDGHVRNMSSPAHTEDHRDYLVNSGLEFRGGSLVYEDARVSLRMPPRDHEPMHVHVCSPGTATETKATVRFDRYPEILAGKLDASLLAHVVSIVEAHRPAMAENWERRRLGLDAAFLGGAR